MRLRLDNGEEVDARIKGKRVKPVCGDRVDATPIDKETDWLITRIAKRRNELTRPNVRGQVEVLAANLDYLVVVAAAEPKPDWFIVDRYLCAAELMGIDAAVIFNKTDLVQEIPENELAAYRSLGYDVVTCSAIHGEGVAAVGDLLSNHCSIIVGQSGVGKSSIINEIIGDELQRTSTISDKSREGIIDSPGVRDFAPALESSTIASEGFREIRDAAHECRFANCRHLREPNCAVKERCESGTISPRRYESYKRIVNLTEQLSEGRY
jgi:ribosome biogenesis GTPase